MGWGGGLWGRGGWLGNFYRVGLTIALAIHSFDSVRSLDRAGLGFAEEWAWEGFLSGFAIALAIRSLDPLRFGSLDVS